MTITPYTESVNTTEAWPPLRIRMQKRTRPTTSVPFSGDWVDVHTAVGNSEVVSVVSSKSGYRDDEWRSKIRNSECLILPYSRTGVKYTPGAADAVIGGKGGPLSGDYKTQYRAILEQANFARPSFFGNVPTLMGQGLQNLLVTEMVADAKSSALQAMVSLMEGKQTFQMFGSTVERLATLLKAAHRALRGDPRALKQLKERIDVHGATEGLSLWLEWRYGWRILLREIDAAFEALSELQLQMADVLRRSRAREETGGTTSTATTSTHNSWTFSPTTFDMLSLTIKRTVKTEFYRGEALGFYTLDETALDRKSLGLHAIPTLYELVPLSFVADWFTNVGTWLQAYATLVPGMQWRGAQYAALRRSEIQLDLVGGSLGSPAYGFELGAAGPATAQRFDFVRSAVNPDQPVLPVTYDGLNLERCIDAVALVKTRLGRLTTDAALWRFDLPSWSK